LSSASADRPRRGAKVPDGQISDLGVQRCYEKYSALPRPQINDYLRTVPFRQEGRIASRHERGTGCGGRESVGAHGNRRAGPLGS
jgi:hypothetical protein